MTEKESGETPKTIIGKLTDFLKSATGLITALSGFIAAIIALWALIPEAKTDCSNPQTPKEWQECANQ